ncbi:phosphonate metabolism protein/1,5-bisphosphokinase (PRPP-forming) PhnN [Roseibium algae]|uniref:Ribose 1,5-bisphosphate phosphokinase PhnN n=1 Tax=Roseibium algae TaxID=3123038 RepID=A0ABU8TQF7_9HYPH
MPDNSRQVTENPIGPGRIILVVGPSGAGKDTLLDALREKLKDRPEVHFARRAITRDSDAASEDHDTISRGLFEDLVHSGKVALAWTAHGLGYVIPQHYDEAIQRGETVIANGSRRALPDALKKYQNASILLITAPIEVLAERLAKRGRESRQEIESRLKLANFEIGVSEHVIRIDNVGPIEESIAKIMERLNF